MPEAFTELQRIARLLEKHYREVQDIEFTVERGKLWMLQTRDAKRTARAAVKIAVDLAKEKLITREEAVLRVTPEHVDFFLHPQFDPESMRTARAERRLLASGLNVSPGAAVGQLAFDADTAERWAKEKKAVVMIRAETKPDDVHGMLAARGILTSRGGRTSHAALVARQFGKPAVVGVMALEVDAEKKEATIKRSSVVLREGDWVSIDGTTGEVFLGQVETMQPSLEDPRADRAARLGGPVPPPGRVGQRRLPARCRARTGAGGRGHRPVPHRAHVLRDRAAPAGPDARSSPGTTRSGTRCWASCSRCSARTSRASSGPWTGSRSPSG